MNIDGGKAAGNKCKTKQYRDSRDGERSKEEFSLVPDEKYSGWPYEIELFLYSERPEMKEANLRAGSEVVNQRRTKILKVTHQEPPHPVPMEMQEGREQKEDNENAVIKGKDPEDAAGVELGKEAGILKRIEKNARNKKPGENKEEIDAEKSIVKDISEKADEKALAPGVRLKNMGKNDHEDS